MTRARQQTVEEFREENKALKKLVSSLREEIKLLETRHPETAVSYSRISKLEKLLQLRSRKLKLALAKLNSFASTNEAAQERIRTSEARFHQIIENIPISYVEVDKNMRVTFINKAAEITSGYTMQDIKDGFNLSEIVASSNQLHVNFRLALRGKRRELFSYKLKKKDGNLIDTLVLSIPSENDGIINGIKIFVIDITENIQLVEALKKSEEKFRNFAQLLPETIFEIDMNGNFNFLNDASYKMFGFCREDSIPNAFDMVIASDIPVIRINMQQLLRNIKSTGHEYTAIRKDGSTFPILLYASPFFEYGKPAGFRGIIIDITERKRIEDALVRSEKDYRILTDQMPLGIYRTNPEGKFLFANPVLAKLLGYDSMEELKAQQVQNLFDDPETRSKQMSNWTPDNPERTLEYILRKRDGSNIWVHDTFRVYFTEEGRIDYMNGILEDITDKKLLEERLKQSQKLEAIGTLTGGIAHDFNNLIMGMQLFTELAMKSLAPGDKAKDSLDKVLDAQRKAKELIEQIHSFSSHPDSEMQLIDLAQTVNASILYFLQFIPENIYFTKNIDSCGNMQGNALQIQRMVNNLCQNAVQAMSDGGTLQISLKRVRANDPLFNVHALSRRREWARLTVRDTGYGMDTGTLSRIFDPFFTTKRVGSGSGLGLTIVQGIVNQCNGKIIAESMPGKGTTFYVYLPVQ
jgi:two-component system, cell cycle sensor histidine kinase and response regulator CckA